MVDSQGAESAAIGLGRSDPESDVQIPRQGQRKCTRPSPRIGSLDIERRDKMISIVTLDRVRAESKWEMLEKASSTLLPNPDTNSR